MVDQNQEVRRISSATIVARKGSSRMSVVIRRMQNRILKEIWKVCQMMVMFYTVRQQ